MPKPEKPLTLKFKLEPSIEEIEYLILNKYKKRLDEFKAQLNKIFKNDFMKVQPLMRLPRFMLRDAIELALRTAITGEIEYIEPDFYAKAKFL